MTFALGLASVFMFEGSLYSDEIYVDLPEVKSDSVIFVIPKKEICIPYVGGSHYVVTKEFVKEWELNCLPKSKTDFK